MGKPRADKRANYSEIGREGQDDSSGASSGGLAEADDVISQRSLGYVCQLIPHNHQSCYDASAKTASGGKIAGRPANCYWVLEVRAHRVDFFEVHHA